MSKKNKSTPEAVLGTKAVPRPPGGVDDGSDGAAAGGFRSVHEAARGFSVAAIEEKRGSRFVEAWTPGETLRARDSRLRKQSAALADLTHARIQHRGDLRAALSGITEAAARALEVERASVWLFNENGSKIRCCDLYERRLDFHSEGVELAAGNYPAYFRALEKAFIIAAAHARNDSRTLEFTNDYLGPLGITSVLDAPVRLGEKLVGVVRHEHVGSPRSWALDEQNFAGSIADLTSLALEDAELKRTAAALRESEARFASFMNNTSALAWMKDGRFRYVYVNQPFERFYGRKRQEIVGKDDFELFSLKTARELRANDEKVLFTSETLQTFETVPRPDGQPRYWLVFKFPFSHSAGERFVGGMAIDVTELRRVEEALLESENLLRTIIEAEPECVKLVSADGRLLQMNRAGLNMLEADSFIQVAQRPVMEVVTPDHRTAFESLLKAVFRGESHKLEFEIVGLKGSRRWLETHAVPLRNHRREITAMLSVTRDVTEQKRAEEAVRSLSRRIVAAQEAERHRVARELHDSVNQLLASVRFRVQSIEGKIANSDKRLAGEVSKTARLLEHALQEVRRISRNLRPSELDDLGLVPAVRSLCEEFQKRTGITCELTFGRLPKRISADIELTFYRIIQEALSNVEKHARAGRVRLGVAREGSSLKLNIQDDGRGLEAAATKSAKKKSGFGLLNMRERAAFVGGTLKVSSSPGQGTGITVKVPINAGPAET